MNDEDAQDEREPKPFHRCWGAMADHCRTCSYLDDEAPINDEGESDE